MQKQLSHYKMTMYLILIIGAYKIALNFVDKIRHVNIKRHFMLASFDIVKLYTSVPIAETVEMVKKNLTENDTLHLDTLKIIYLSTQCNFKTELFYF